MRSAAAAALALALAVGCAHPRCPSLPAGPPIDPRPFLWEVSGPATVYLFGTFHAGGRADVPALAFAKLARARMLVTETAPIDPERVRSLMLFPHGESLPPLLPQDDWFALRDALAGVIREPQLRRARPWYAMSLLTKVMAHLPSPSMDEALRLEARARGLRLAVLETPEQQLAALRDAVTPEDLVQAIRDRDRMRCGVAALASAYHRGDGEALLRELGARARATLLDERNRRWLPEIEAYLAGPGAFVAVGTDHLVGPHGLPALLAARGHHVTRLAP